MFGKVINAERMLKRDLGGGTTLDLGIYNIQFSQLAFGGKKLVHILIFQFQYLNDVYQIIYLYIKR